MTLGIGKRILLCITLGIGKRTLLCMTLGIGKRILLCITLGIGKRILLCITLGIGKRTLLCMTLGIGKRTLLCMTLGIGKRTLLCMTPGIGIYSALGSALNVGTEVSLCGTLSTHQTTSAITKVLGRTCDLVCTPVWCFPFFICYLLHCLYSFADHSRIGRVERELHKEINILVVRKICDNTLFHTSVWCYPLFIYCLVNCLSSIADHSRIGRVESGLRKGTTLLVIRGIRDITSGPMDPADLSNQLARIAARQEEQDHRMDQISLALQTLLNRSNTGTTNPPDPVLPRVSSVPPEGHRLSMKAPLRYDGTPSLCRGFLTQLEILFENNPGSCMSDKAKVGYLINHLTEKALLWATPLWENKKPIIYDYEGFTSELKRTFDPSRRATNAGRSLFHIKQGNKRVADYAIEFKTLTSEVLWPNDVLTLAFTEGLNEAFMFELAPLKLPESLDHLIDFCIAMDDQIRERRHPRDRPRRVLPPLPSLPRHTSTSGGSENVKTDLPVVEPMQIGKTGISEAERAHRREKGLCFYCAGADHFRLRCPQRPRVSRAEHSRVGFRTGDTQVVGSLCASFVDNEKKKSRILLPVSLTWEGFTSRLRRS
uniref:Retrotransposon gag domain-containing protein n=1 Tax=Leptobrachium leishanense TaxID=445787 RepID=A0A8C5PK53_9ANUR